MEKNDKQINEKQIHSSSIHPAVPEQTHVRSSFYSQVFPDLKNDSFP